MQEFKQTQKRHLSISMVADFLLVNQANFLLGYKVITMIIVLITTKKKPLGTYFNQENWMLVIRLICRGLLELCSLKNNLKISYQIILGTYQDQRCAIIIPFFSLLNGDMVVFLSIGYFCGYCQGMRILEVLVDACTKKRTSK